MKIVRYHQPAAAALAPLYSFAGRNPVVAFEHEFDRLSADDDIFAAAKCRRDV